MDCKNESHPEEGTSASPSVPLVLLQRHYQSNLIILFIKRQQRSSESGT